MMRLRRNYHKRLLLPWVVTPVLLAFLALPNQLPGLGAAAATPLRAVIGNEGVAWLETIVFGLQDNIKQIKFGTGIEQAGALWQVSPTPAPIPSPTPSGREERDASALPLIASITDREHRTVESSAHRNPAAPSTQGPQATRPAEASPTPTATPMPTATAMPTPWQPSPVTPLGSLEGEGVWSPYIEVSASEPLAYRTFLQPDPERPFTVVAVVAFDMTRVRLNYVLGTEEPSLPGGPRGQGVIPAAHKVPGVLLAAFNGGFKATHGGYGAMADQTEALPPLEGLATVAITRDGEVRIGRWGTEIQPSDELVAWRQNAHLVIQDGQITPLVYENSLYYWSGSINNEVVTWRSGLGLSDDGRTLYYFAGPSMHMPALGAAMIAVGVEQGMLLDINPYWVHFTAISAGPEGLSAQALFAEGMNQHIDRFLRPYARDFFYVTALDAVP